MEHSIQENTGEATMFRKMQRLTRNLGDLTELYLPDDK